MSNNKIRSILNLILKSDVVIDVGCDHCLLAIELLKNKKANIVINVDINDEPLEYGKKNLIKHNLIENTINIVNNGLNGLEKNEIIVNYINRIDYCVIAGMGSNNIIDIMNSNCLDIKNFILHTTKDEYKLRNYLISNNFKIINETYVEENEIFYPIFNVKKSANKIHYSKEELYFGKINNICNLSIYKSYLQNKLFFLQNIVAKNGIDKINENLKEEYELLMKRIENEIK